MSALDLILSGGNTFGYVVAGLLFFRFWQRSRDQLFAAFAAAFWLLGLNQFLVAWFGPLSDYSAPFYMLRLLAFMIIIAAIVKKNLQPSK